VNLLSTLFVHPIALRYEILWMVIPFSLAVAVVYKTVRTQSLKRLPMEIVLLGLYIIAGVIAIMLAGWAIVRWIL